MPALLVFRLFLFLGFLFAIDILAYLSLYSISKDWKHHTMRRIVINIPWIISILFFLYAVIHVVSVSNVAYDYIKARNYFTIFGILFIIIFLKSILILFKLIERIFYLLIRIAFKFFLRNKSYNKEKIYKHTTSVFFTISILACLLFLYLLSYGMIKGKYNFEIEKHEIRFKNLPESFDGLKIIQISDVHFGSFYDTTHFNKAVDLINNQHADIIFFTGDLINNEAIEANDYIGMFQRLKSKYGKFAIMGNHDMGDYRRWYTESGKINNYLEVVRVLERMGFRVLLDENCYTKIDHDSIAIIGVKSWSLPPFKKFGNLKNAMNGVPPSIFKILLSHNPSHWNKEVKGKTNIDLTLSGHTHGMQIGIYNESFKWSPIQYIYPHWGGLYKEGEQYLNVNKGLGILGLPLRIGINPEISLIILKKQ